jgi:hypothetical protein
MFPGRMTRPSALQNITTKGKKQLRNPAKFKRVLEFYVARTRKQTKSQFVSIYL